MKLNLIMKLKPLHLLVLCDKTEPKYCGVTNALNWINAQNYCRLNGTDLASPFTLEEHSLVQQVATVQGLSWIGLYRDEWRWVDETKVSSFMWQTLPPDNIDPQEHCGTLNNGKLDDKKCTNKYYFLCDGSPVFRHVIKLKVKTDQNVLHLAVQVAILEQIKQKLNLNRTVSWRIQPDGTVFHKINQNNST